MQFLLTICRLHVFELEDPQATKRSGRIAEKGQEQALATVIRQGNILARYVLSLKWWCELTWFQCHILSFIPSFKTWSFSPGLRSLAMPMLVVT